MADGIFSLERPANEPILSYAPGTWEREGLKAAAAAMRTWEMDVPCIIGGKEVRTGNLGRMTPPHDHRHLLGTYHKAGPKEVEMAVSAAASAAREWAALPWEERISIFLRAAELLSGPFRMTLNAATLLCQGKNAFQAEIDSACELIDFFRFNSYYARRIYEDQPLSSKGVWNRLEYRPLEGFVFAATPFNFTSIAGNLPSAPALLGNVVLWKPASTAVYSGYQLMLLFKAAGLPDGVINFLPGDGASVGAPALADPLLAGVHFTGSTAVFKGMWKSIGANIDRYHSYPRLVGETGGKDFIFAHASADIDELVCACARGAFEYQGQKCSAASRAFIPKSLWKEFRDRLAAAADGLPMGPPEDFGNFVNAVIDKNAFGSIKRYIDEARHSPDAELIAGGVCDDTNGWFIRPTVILARRPDYRSMTEEIFGPVLTVFVYDDEKLEETLDICDSGTQYSLTGSVFARDRYAIARIEKRLVNAAGNFYINDKPTGAVVGQQPFGGGRASGTNDKAGSAINLYRWLSPRAIKETLVPPRDISYPFMRRD